MIFYSLVLSAAFGWDYAGRGDWPTECNVPQQSPVNIDTQNTKTIKGDYELKMIFLGATKPRKIENTGNMVRVHADLGYIEVGEVGDKRAFNVKWLEFHTPSEHTVDGVPYPLEMHAIMEVEDKHYERDKANMAILSVLFKAGIESYFMNTLEIWKLPSGVGSYDTSDTSNINIREAVVKTDSYYFYKGSATHPDYECRNDVLWYVIEDIKEAKDWQIGMFEHLYENGNNREVSVLTNQVYHSNALVVQVALLWLIFAF